MDDKKKQLEEAVKQRIINFVEEHPGEHNRFSLSYAINPKNPFEGQKLIDQAEKEGVIKRGLDPKLGYIRISDRGKYFLVDKSSMQ